MNQPCPERVPPCPETRGRTRVPVSLPIRRDTDTPTQRAQDTLRVCPGGQPWLRPRGVGRLFERAPASTPALGIRVSPRKGSGVVVALLRGVARLRLPSRTVHTSGFSATGLARPLPSKCRGVYGSGVSERSGSAPLWALGFFVQEQGLSLAGVLKSRGLPPVVRP
jgi:hypothetical protein